jgi:hypothetical protein
MCILIATPSLAGDNGNGTVTVNGLVWLKNAGCLGSMTWAAANRRVASLANGECGLTDKSTAGQWRLPTIDELKGIYSAKGSFSNVQSSDYWSGTSHASRTSHAWFIYMNGGYLYCGSKASSYYAWAVRNP